MAGENDKSKSFLPDSEQEKVRAAQLLKAFASNQPMIFDLLNMLAKDTFSFYKALLAAGFNDAQALQLAQARLVGMGGGKQ